MGVIEPGDETLGAMAAGTLDPVFRLMLETRATLDNRAEATVLEADLIGSAYFHGDDEVPMRGDALASVMQQIADDGAMHCDNGDLLDDCLPAYLDGLPHDLCAVVSGSLARHDWQTTAEGIRILALQVPFSSVEQNGGSVYLVEMDAGAGVARHRHLGEEYTLVLKGAVSAENEELTHVGSLLMRSSGSVHRPRATSGELCAMLVILTGNVEYIPDQISA